jgi:hypothetical protein
VSPPAGLLDLFDGGLGAFRVTIDGADLGALASEQGRDRPAVAQEVVDGLAGADDDSLFTLHASFHANSPLAAMQLK